MQSWSFLSFKPAPSCSTFFFFNDTATTEIYTLSLHDALPISSDTVKYQGEEMSLTERREECWARKTLRSVERSTEHTKRSEEHTSELQSPDHIVCRLLLEKKKNTNITNIITLQIKFCCVNTYN